MDQVKVIIKKNEKYLLLRRSDEDEPKNNGLWECAGGKIEPDEAPEQCAAREVMEETGLKIRIIKEIIVLTDKKANKAYVYLGEPISKDIKISHEHSEYKWFTLEDIRKLKDVIYKELFIELVEKSLVEF